MLAIKAHKFAGPENTVGEKPLIRVGSASVIVGMQKGRRAITVGVLAPVRLIGPFLNFNKF